MTLKRRKQAVLGNIREILDAKDVTFDELRNSRRKAAQEARQHVCGLVWLVLNPWMSEVDMARWLEMKRTSFRYHRVQYFKEK